VSDFIPNPNFIHDLLNEAPAQHMMDDFAQQGLEAAQRLVPVDTGELRDSLHIEDGEAEGSKRIVAGTDHWQFPEFGTSTQAAEPFLRPIIDELGLNR
jgi:HK97 gp10 family phage protein